MDTEEQKKRRTVVVRCPECGGHEEGCSECACGLVDAPAAQATVEEAIEGLRALLFARKGPRRARGFETEAKVFDLETARLGAQLTALEGL